jgi:hypothetical protein
MISLIYIIGILSFDSFSGEFDQLPYDKNYNLELDYKNLTAKEKKELSVIRKEGYIDDQDKSNSEKFKKILEVDFDNVQVDESSFYKMSKDELISNIRKEVKELKELIALTEKMETERRKEKDVVAAKYRDILEKEKKRKSENRTKEDFSLVFENEKNAWKAFKKTIEQAIRKKEKKTRMKNKKKKKGKKNKKGKNENN